MSPPTCRPFFQSLFNEGGEALKSDKRKQGQFGPADDPDARRVAVPASFLYVKRTIVPFILL